MAPNILVIALCALIPFFIGFVWFHPKTFGGDYWKKVSGLTDEQGKKKIKPGLMALTLLLNFFIAFGIFIVTVHGTHILGIVGGNPELLKTGTGLAFMREYGNNFTNWTHGIGHGLFLGTLAFVVPIIGYVTIFEHKSFRYFLVYTGYWAICLTIMSCIITQYGWIKVY